jgi:hypothetical protein
VVLAVVERRGATADGVRALCLRRVIEPAHRARKR